MSSLSEHERKQFDMLAESLVAADPVLSKQHKKDKKRSEMTLFSAADMKMVAVGGMLIGLLFSIGSIVNLEPDVSNVFHGLWISLISFSLWLKFPFASASPSRSSEGMLNDA